MSIPFEVDIFFAGTHTTRFHYPSLAQATQEIVKAINKDISFIHECSSKSALMESTMALLAIDESFKNVLSTRLYDLWSSMKDLKSVKMEMPTKSPGFGSAITSEDGKIIAHLRPPGCYVRL